MQVSQNVVRKLHSDPTFKPDKDSVVVQLMGQIRNTEDTISSVLVALEYGPDMATIYRLNQIKGTYETTVKPQANLEGVDNPEESTVNLEGLDDPKESLYIKWKFAEMETDMKSKIQHIEKIKGTYETTVKPQANLQGVDNQEESQATLEGIDDPEESQATPEGVDNPEESQATLEGLDDPKESLANLEEENSDQKSQIIAMKKKFAEMETDMKSKIQHIEKEVGALDGRLLQSEKRTAVCGYQGSLSFSSDTILIFERVYDEVNSGGTLQEN